ncbi:alpha-(1,3)-fucosyltransferase C-like [Paramacrobiotus metropolitanus]|uniref:alpha-(1,3)-fucosyltransferase C-like n=1 Tax=Paramacrobiotus metropolitanus TaxID=2943436 RepID=UPI002445C30D|nr:alpha-(1,3)-fucosyltransferase C-like [Paramacrobiotus metropolitanus]
MESLVHTFGHLDRQRGSFNLTFTYRLDSDVVTDSYFQHFHPNVMNEQQLDELLTKKAGFAVTFVSNCHWIPSRRDVYVKQLANYYHVDIYGKCGTKQCSTDTTEICDQLVADCKFYLAFETVPSEKNASEGDYRIKENIGQDVCTVTEAVGLTSLQKVIEKRMALVNKRATSRAQCVQKFKLLPEDFSIPGGELGPTLKLKRNVVAAKYGALIEQFYDDTDS